MITATDLDEDVRELTYSVEQYYKNFASSDTTFPVGLDGSLRAIFEDLDNPADPNSASPRWR